MMAAAVQSQGSAFEVDAVQSLFPFRFSILGRPAGYPYDVAPDGQRFLIPLVEDVQSASAPPITIVENWQAALKK
jgi:hypothetical protein